MGISLSDSQKAAWDAGNEYTRVAILSEAMAQAAGGAAQAMAGTSTAAWHSLSSAGDELAVSFGKIFDADVSAVLRSIASAVRELKEWFDSLSPSTKNTIEDVAIVAAVVTGLTAAFSSAALVIPPLIAVLGSLGATFLTVILPIVAGAAIGVGVFVGALEVMEHYINKQPWGTGLKILGEMVGSVTQQFKDLFNVSSQIPTVPQVPAAVMARNSSHQGLGSNPYDFGGESQSQGVKGEDYELMMNWEHNTKEVEEGLKDLGQTLTQATINAELFGGFFAKNKAAISTISSAAASAGDAAEQGIIQNLQDTAKAYTDAANATHDVALKAKYLAEAGDAANKAKEQQDNPHAGDIVNGAVQGFMQGGIIGAVLGVIGAFLSKLKGFGDMLALLQPVIDNVMKVLNPIFRILSSITAMFQKIADCGVEPAVNALAWILGKIADAITSAVNFVFHIINDALGWVGVHIDDVGSTGDSGPSTPKYQQAADSAAASAAEAVSQADVKGGKSAAQAATDYASTYSADFAKYADVWQQAYNQTGDEAAATAIANQALQDVTASLDTLATTTQSVTDALTNVPSGFKIALATFNASAGGNPLAGSSGAVPVNVGTIIVQTNDPAKFTKDLQDYNNWRNQVQTGTTMPRPSGNSPRQSTQ
jgi:hypothetical protein